VALYFNSNRAGGFDSQDIYMARRPSVLDAFSDVKNLGPGVNTPAVDGAASISRDGQTLYSNSSRDGGIGENDLYEATRWNGGEPPAVLQSRFDIPFSGNAIAFEAATGNVLVKSAYSEAVLEYTPEGSFVRQFPVPGPSGDSAGIDLLEESLNIGETEVPAGTLLFFNVDAEPNETLYALERNIGTVLAEVSLATD
jgi:hypothetical protein